MSGARVAAILGAAWLALTVVAWSRPPTPYQWDECEVWLLRAAAESRQAGASFRCVATGWRRCPVPAIGRGGYPPAYPIAVGLVARLLPASLDVSAAAVVVNLALLAGFLCVLGRLASDSTRLAVGLALLVSPFVLDHLRAGYADLAVGMVAALVNARLIRLHEDRAPRGRAWRAVGLIATSTLLVQLKHEGIVHLCVAIVVFHVIRARRLGWKEGWRTPAPLALAGVVSLASLTAWEVLARDVPPTLGPGWLAGPRALPVFAYHAARHMLDPLSWGATWPVVGAVAVGRRDRAFLFYVVTAFAVFAVAFVLGPESTLTTFRMGTSLNRLLMQILVAGMPFVVASPESARWVSSDECGVEAGIPPAERPAVTGRVQSDPTASSGAEGRRTLRTETPDFVVTPCSSSAFR